MSKNILILGQRNTGKTTIIFKIIYNKILKTIPTIGLLTEKFFFKKNSYSLTEIGGTPDSFHLWEYFYKYSKAIIYVTSPIIENMELEYNLINKLISNYNKKILLIINKNKDKNIDILNKIKYKKNLYIISTNRIDNNIINSIKHWIYFYT